MEAVETYLIELGGGETVRVQFERADPTDPAVADTLIDIDLQTFTEATFSRYAANALQRHGSVFLLRKEETVIGTAVCIRSFGNPDEALILSMGILHGWRGRGIGRRFVSSVLRALHVDGFSAVNLEVVSSNQAAMHVYDGLGFQVTAQYEGRSSGHPLLHLRRALPLQHPQPALIAG